MVTCGGSLGSFFVAVIVRGVRRVPVCQQFLDESTPHTYFQSGLAMSVSRACKAIGLVRSSIQYRTVETTEDALRLATIRQATSYGRYGYSEVTELLRIEARLVRCLPALHRLMGPAFPDKGKDNPHLLEPTAIKSCDRPTNPLRSAL